MWGFGELFVCYSRKRAKTHSKHLIDTHGIINHSNLKLNLPSLLRVVLDFLSLFTESFKDLIEPDGLLAYCNFSGDISEVPS